MYCVAVCIIDPISVLYLFSILASKGEHGKNFLCAAVNDFNKGYNAVRFISAGSRHMHHQRVEVTVECLCNQGCKAVWKHIAALERGESIPGTEGLAPGEVRQVLDELRAVMAVYEGSCSPN